MFYDTISISSSYNENVWDERGENQNTHFFFRKPCRLGDNVEKYDRVRQTTYGNIKERSHFLYRINKTRMHKHTQNI